MKTSYFLKHLAGTLLFFSLLFISAGRLDYLQGWIYSSIGLIMLIVNYTLLRTDPELLKERSKPGEGTKNWDKTSLEDRTLRNELNGYLDYAGKTRYRIMPLIW